MSTYSTRSSDFTPSQSSSSSHQWGSQLQQHGQPEQQTSPPPSPPRPRRSITRAEQEQILRQLLQNSSLAMPSSSSQPASDSSDSSLDIRHITASTPPPTRSRSTTNTFRIASELAERQREEEALRASASSSSSSPTSFEDYASLSIAQRRKRDLLRLSKLTQPRSTSKPTAVSRARPSLLADASWDVDQPSSNSSPRRVTLSAAAQLSSTPSRRQSANASLPLQSILKRQPSKPRVQEVQEQLNDDGQSVKGTGSGLEDLEAEYEALQARLEEVKRRFSRWHGVASSKVRIQEEEEREKRRQEAERREARMVDEEPKQTPTAVEVRQAEATREQIKEEEEAAIERSESKRGESSQTSRHGGPLDDITEEGEQEEESDEVMDTPDVHDESERHSQAGKSEPKFSNESELKVADRPESEPSVDLTHSQERESKPDLSDGPELRVEDSVANEPGVDLIKGTDVASPEEGEDPSQTLRSDSVKADLDQHPSQPLKSTTQLPKLMFGSAIVLLISLWMWTYLPVLLPGLGNMQWPSSIQRGSDNGSPITSAPAASDRYQARYDYSMEEQRWMMDYYDPMYPELYSAPEQDDYEHHQAGWGSLGRMASMVGLLAGGKDFR